MLRGEGVKRKNSLFKIRVSGKNSSEYQGERWIYFERISHNWYENRTNFSSYVKITTFHPWKDNTLLPLLPNGQTFSFLFQTAVHLARSKAGNSFHRPSIDPLPPPLSPYKYTFNWTRKGGGSDGHLFENPWETSFLRCCSVLELRREEDCPDGLEGKGDHCLNWERG